VILSAAIRIEVPDWLGPFVADWPGNFPDEAAAMGLAIALARENVRRGTGGPFGALVIESADGRLVAAGVNLVLASHCSLAHAELVALGLAQQALGCPNLGEILSGGCTLVSSAEPCAMCLGAIPWAGVGRLVYGARDADIRAAGFDEGDKPPDWELAYARRGIAVVRDCLRDQAVGVLAEYRRSGGMIYGPVQGPETERDQA